MNSNRNRTKFIARLMIHSCIRTPMGCVAAQEPPDHIHGAIELAVLQRSIADPISG